MQIVDSRPGCYVLECECPRAGPFRAERLTLTVECPRCGRTRLTADLVATWVLRTRDGTAATAAD
jgi:hypothetical protein